MLGLDLLLLVDLTSTGFRVSSSLRGDQDKKPTHLLPGLGDLRIDIVERWETWSPDSNPLFGQRHLKLARCRGPKDNQLRSLLGI